MTMPSYGTWCGMPWRIPVPEGRLSERPCPGPETLLDRRYEFRACLGLGRQRSLGRAGAWRNPHLQCSSAPSHLSTECRRVSAAAWRPLCSSPASNGPPVDGDVVVGQPVGPYAVGLRRRLVAARAAASRMAIRASGTRLGAGLSMVMFLSPFAGDVRQLSPRGSVLPCFNHPPVGVWESPEGAGTAGPAALPRLP